MADLRLHTISCVVSVSLCVLLVCSRTTRAETSTTTQKPSILLPECDFDVHLKPELLCEMQEPEVQAYYPPGQKFCACPMFSECIHEKVEHPITMDLEMKFLCYKRPAYADKKHEDMTMGILRKDFYK